MAKREWQIGDEVRVTGSLFRGHCFTVQAFSSQCNMEDWPITNNPEWRLLLTASSHVCFHPEDLEAWNALDRLASI